MPEPKTHPVRPSLASNAASPEAKALVLELRDILSCEEAWHIAASHLGRAYEKGFEDGLAAPCGCQAKALRRPLEDQPRAETAGASLAERRRVSVKVMISTGPEGVALATDPPNVDRLALLGLLDVAKAIVLDSMKGPSSPIVAPPPGANLVDFRRPS